MSKAKPPRAPNAQGDSGLRASIQDALSGDSLRLLSFLVVLFAIAQAWSYSERLACMDYYQFWTVGQVARQANTGDIYSTAERQRLGKAMWELASEQAGPNAEARESSKRLQAAQSRQVLETYSTPWLYTLFGISAGGNYDSDQDRYQHFSLLCQVLAVALICSLLGYPPAASALAAALFISWFSPTSSETHVGNVNRVQLAMLAVFLWVESRTRWPARHLLAGVVFGCSLMFKPNLAFVALALGLGWIFSRQHRKLLNVSAGVAVGCLFSLGASAWFFRSFHPWLSWAREVPRLMTEYGRGLSQGDYALEKVLSDALGFTGTSFVPFVLLGILAFVLFRAGFRMRSRSDAERDQKQDLQWDVLLVSLGALLSLLATQLAWLHYFILAIPAALYVLRPVSGGAPGDHARRRLFRGLGILAVAMIALDPLRAVFNLNDADATAVVVSGGTLLLFFVALLDGLFLTGERA